MTTRFLSPTSASLPDIGTFLRGAVRTAFGLAALATVVLTVLSVRYVAFECTHGVQPIVRHLIDFVSP
jgi:hypothetical protein